MPGSGFLWRVRSPVPDAECQDPDFGGELDLPYLMLNARIRVKSDLLYLMLNSRIRISVEGQISCTVINAECQHPDFGGESDLLYLS
jgi:hypothetical protein